ncbi:NAD(P)-binding protein [Halobacteria archaeon AArc-curdl1]|uniref:NAD(P)-binding protein n=1 Tax=Natronosalvus hydrolyticus TaxID=2979988 RepID=A0AAP2ZAP1_9EURY|nr:NAD(P)-binding protein [Halobacteria archaeon AArc-curdl1]
MNRIGIVGAGAAAAGAAYILSTQQPGAAITVLEKSRGLCGRAATRRKHGCVYEYGANYLKADDNRVTDLVTNTLETDGLVNIDEPIWTFDSEGTVEPGRESDDHKWSYEAGLTQLAKRLFARTEATIHQETHVEAIRRDGEIWRVEDTDGNEWGPFDVLLLNPPAPQTAALLERADWASEHRRPLQDAVENVPYRTVITAVAHYPFKLDVPYYALVNTDKAHDIGWVAREECKPGHVPDGESLLVIQAGNEWSKAQYDAPRENNLRTLIEGTASLLEDERLTGPDWTDYQGWRYALPEDGVSRAPLEAAEADGLYLLGDWVAGEGRLHAALANGLEVGERVASDLESSA